MTSDNETSLTARWSDYMSLLRAGQPLQCVRIP
jgi:hypothetical protein